MSKYVGIKLVEAEPMSEEQHNREINPHGVTPGYQITHADGYKSWIHKDVFDKAHIKVGKNNTIQERNINEFIKEYDISQWGDKTTVVHATLVNGFVMSESSSCVDPANFNIDIGANICKQKIQNKLWGMLGFMLQTAVKGVK